MKVLIIPSWYPTLESSNAGIFFKEQVMALQKSGVEATVIYPEFTSLKNVRKGFVKREIVKRYEEGVLTYRYKGFFYLPKIRNSKKYLTYYRLERLYKLYVKENGEPDVIHAHSVRWGGWGAVKLGDKYSLPVVITEHSSSYGRNRIPKRDLKSIENTLNSADQIISVGSGLKKELLNYGARKNIKVIPNNVDLNFFVKKINKSKNNKKVRFFSLSSLTKNKGVDDLILAFSQAFKDDLSTELVIGGSGIEFKNLKSLTKNEGIESQVIFLGELNREKVAEQMNKCDVFVLASEYETFGVVYVEALACGKPIIATRCGGPEEIVTKENGVLVEKGNLVELSKAMLFMKKNHKNYNSNKIRTDCLTKYGNESVMQRLKAVYTNVIDRYRTARK